MGSERMCGVFLTQASNILMQKRAEITMSSIRQVEGRKWAKEFSVCRVFTERK